MSISKEELKNILTQCNATSPGQWTSFIEGRDHNAGSSFIRTGTNDIELSGATKQDQDFIAAAKQNIPRLISELARLNGWSL